ncbi:THUMP domain-containing class I SAM-dependent RNA methyltransferase [Caldimonas sp. KR1-144]|uniref:THUMP domain-containing class I SAM-dependent RNA methyltransferase n=1 Tax=Caldimonas sp. KR1-144 TaxID=3400911 RepID=UPI003BFD755F
MNDWLFLPCAAGVEAWLADEAARLLPQARIEPQRGGVAVQGGAREAMALNLGSRIAQRVLWRVAYGPYRNEDDLYALARGVAWEQWLGPRETLRVDTTAQRSPLRSLNFAALRVKDAVCDQLREREGARPSVDTQRPDLPLVLHLGEHDASLYVDTSGEALFKRGWREDKGEAPLKETLAAAMLAAAGWQGREEDGPLLDPVCGSGTIAVEAAQLACGIAPGLHRRFAFERQRPFRDAASQSAWRELREAARAAQHAPRVPIFAGDVSFRMTDFAARNAERAGVRAAIEFKTADALQRPAPAERGTLMLNPPYGERIAPKGTRGERVAREGFVSGGESGAPADDFFARLAAHWKRHYAGWTAWVLSPDAKLPQAMRLKESRRVPMWNGPIECRLFRFDMVAGSARAPKDAAPSDAG